MGTTSSIIDYPAFDIGLLTGAMVMHYYNVYFSSLTNLVVPCMTAGFFLFFFLSGPVGHLLDTGHVRQNVAIFWFYWILQHCMI